jgi:hypothetical protein
MRELTSGFDAMRRCLYNLYAITPRKVLALIGNFNNNFFARNCMSNKDYLAVVSRNTMTAMSY